MQNRYHRQEVLEEIGVDGQQKLSDASIAIVGCGGLGSVASAYLAGAGVGKIILIDGDVVHQSNLHRQVFFKDGKPVNKALAMATHLKNLNPEIDIQAVPENLTKYSINKYLKGVDMIMECTDDILCKYMVNDFAALSSIPMVYGAIHKYDGYVSIFPNLSESDIHLRDIFPEPDINVPSCSEVGVFPTLAGIIGILQATEAIKWFCSSGEPLSGRLLCYNILNHAQRIIGLKKVWEVDMIELFEKTSYAADEVSWEELEANPTTYKLISILEHSEHEDILDDVLHRPLSRGKHEELLVGERPIVFYCLSGLRSGILVHRLKEGNCALDLYSLKGGLESIE